LQTRLAPHIRTFIKAGMGVYNIVIMEKLYEKDLENMILQSFGIDTVNIQCSINKISGFKFFL
jgi:phage tail tube protein FII